MAAAHVRDRRGRAHARGPAGVGRSSPRWSLVAVLVAAAAGGRRQARCACSSSSSRCSCSPRCGTCWPATPAWSRSASRPTSASAATRSSCSPTISASNPFLAVPLAGLVAAALALPDRGAGLPVPGRLLRGRHLGDRRGLPAARGQHRRARPRHRPHAEGGVPAGPRDARAGDLLPGPGPRRGRAGRGSTCSCARASGWG